MTNSGDDDDRRDATRAGMPLPPGAKKPDEAAKPAHEETRIGGSVPVLPGAKPPVKPEPAAPKADHGQPAAPPPARREDSGAEKGDVDEDLEATVFEVRSPFSLMHVKPPGHGTPITLSGSSYILGRSRSCDVQLFSPTAHRQHAKLVSRGSGWVLQTVENHVVIANGDLVRGEVQLVHKMRLQLGDDEFVFFDERRAAAQTRTEKSIPPLQRTTSLRAALAAAVVIAVIVVASILWWWM